MIMKQISLLFLMVLTSLKINAYDVEMDGIYYNLIPKAKKAEVTKGDVRYSGVIKIPESIEVDGVIYAVAIIGEDAFSYNSSIRDIWIPKTITTIYSGAFMRAENIKNVYISDLEAWCNISFGSSPLWYAHHLFLNGEEVVNVTIPTSVTTIKNSTFQGLVNLQSVTFHEKIEIIGSQAFYGCTGLVSINLPSSLSVIGESAFYGCDKISTLDLPSNLETIGNHAFRKCIGLSEIVIPKNVTSLSNLSFCDCSNLSTIVVDRDNPVYDSRNDCNAIIETETNTLLTGCRSTIIPNDIDIIGNNAFSNCMGLINVDIPNNVKTIGGNSFDGCEDLQTISLGKGVSIIGAGAFSNCKNIKDFSCYTNDIPKTGNNIFDNSFINYATLHVPNRLIDKYKEIYPWEGFGTIVSLADDNTQNDKCGLPTISCKEGNIYFDCPTEDVSFVSEITVNGAKKYFDNTISSPKSFKISVYATKKGYENSDTATAEFDFSSDTARSGDVDGNGEVNVADHVKLSDIIMGK